MIINYTPRDGERVRSSLDVDRKSDRFLNNVRMKLNHLLGSETRIENSRGRGWWKFKFVTRECSGSIIHSEIQYLFVSSGIFDRQGVKSVQRFCNAFMIHTSLGITL